MADTHEVKLVSTGEVCNFEDFEPRASAVLFREISDLIWSGNCGVPGVTSNNIMSVIPPAEARDVLNAAIRPINRGLVYAGAENLFVLEGRRPDRIRPIFGDMLSEPSSVLVGTRFRDAYMGGERSYFHEDGTEDVMEFIDGHVDYHRVLYADLIFRRNGSNARLRYSIERSQPTQDEPAEVAVHLKANGFAGIGYDGQRLDDKTMTLDQELQLLAAFQLIGGLALPAQTIQQQAS